jgi:hypothetical protein
MDRSPQHTNVRKQEKDAPESGAFLLLEKASAGQAFVGTFPP